MRRLWDAALPSPAARRGEAEEDAFFYSESSVRAISSFWMRSVRVT